MSGDELRGKYRGQGPDTDTARAEARRDDDGRTTPEGEALLREHFPPRSGRIHVGIMTPREEPEWLAGWKRKLDDLTPEQRRQLWQGEWTVYDEVVDWPEDR